MIEFTQNVFMICSYCKDLRRDFYGYDMPDRSCLKHKAKVEGSQIAVVRASEDGFDAYDSRFGCLNFESSGLPVHPIVLEKLLERNSLANQIPVDENATENFTEFERKIDKYNSNFERRHVFEF